MRSTISLLALITGAMSGDVQSLLKCTVCKTAVGTVDGVAGNETAVSNLMQNWSATNEYKPNN